MEELIKVRNGNQTIIVATEKKGWWLLNQIHVYVLDVGQEHPIEFNLSALAWSGIDFAKLMGASWDFTAVREKQKITVSAVARDEVWHGNRIIAWSLEIDLDAIGKNRRPVNLNC